MNHKNPIVKLLFVCSVLAGFFMASCVKTREGEVEDPSTNRAFTPYSFSVKTSVDTAKFTWTAPVLSAGKKLKYTVEISQDSLFGKVEFTKTVDTLGFNILEPTLAVAKRYYARMRVDAFKDQAASKYLYSSSFTINGQNYLRVLRDFEVAPTTALIHWYADANTAGVNKIALTADGGATTSVDVSPTNAGAGAKQVTNLTPGTRYLLQLLAGTKSKGILTFTTPKAVTYTTVLSAGGDLAAAISNAADGDIIGLSPGNYTLAGIFTIIGKSVTIASVSNNPADTKVKVREIDVLGNNGGLTLIGLDIDGNYNGTSYGTQLLVIKGAANGGDPANFADVRIDNCYIHDYTRCLVIANNATTVNTQTIKSFTINNCIIYNIDNAGTSTYYTLSMEKLLFNNLNITKSTFYNLGTGLINISTNLAATTIVPAITVDYCTFNNFGSGGKYLFFDANANKIVYNFSNSIMGNSPLAGGSIQGIAFKCSNTSSTLNFLNNDYFKLYSTSSGGILPLVLTGLNQVSCYSIDVGWTAATVNFSLQSLSADSKVFKMSTSGSTVGDPRWAY